MSLCIEPSSYYIPNVDALHLPPTFDTNFSRQHKLTKSALRTFLNKELMERLEYCVEYISSKVTTNFLKERKIPEEYIYSLDKRLKLYAQRTSPKAVIGFVTGQKEAEKYVYNFMGEEFEFQVEKYFEAKKATDIQRQVIVRSCEGKTETDIDVVCKIDGILSICEAKCVVTLKQKKCVRQIKKARGYYDIDDEGKVKSYVAVPNDTYISINVENSIQKAGGEVIVLENIKRELILKWLWGIREIGRELGEMS